MRVRLPRTGRRAFLTGLGAAAAGAAIPAGAHARRRASWSATGAPRKVLVHPASPADHAACGLLAGGDPFWTEAAEAICTEDAILVRALEMDGVRVIRFEDALANAIRTARADGDFDGWFAAHYPDAGSAEAATADTLLRRGAAAQGGGHLHGALCEFAVMLPAGLLLTHAADPARSHAEALVRFALAYDPELREYPVAFDAHARGMRLRRNEVAVRDGHTLIVADSVAPATAVALALATGMTLVAAAAPMALGRPIVVLEQG